MRFRVYQQQRPTPVHGATDKDGRPRTEWEANLVHVGSVEAHNGPEAIDKARELPIFRVASRKTLGAFPIVEAA